MTNTSGEKFSAELARLSAEFAKLLPGRLADIAAARDAVRESRGPEREAALRQLIGQAHKLAGTAETFGYAPIGRAALQLDMYGAKHLSAGALPDAAVVARVVELADEILSTAKENAAPGATSQVAVATAAMAETSPGSSKDIVVVDDDREQAKRLSAVLSFFGYRVTVLASPEALRDYSGPPPGAVIMDVIFGEDSDAGLRTVRALRAEGLLTAPVLFLSVRNDIDARLDAIRSGADGYITKPVDVLDLVEVLERVIFHHGERAIRVLIVDDDPIVSEFHSAMLRAAGMMTKVLSNPKEVVAAITLVRPDVLLLDIEMPEATGLEVGKVLRQYTSELAYIPIVFLTGKGSTSRRIQSLKVGADAFLTKPVDTNELIETVIARGERGRDLRGLFARLNASETRYRAIMSNASEAILSTNDTGLIVYANAGAERLFGRSEEEMIGHSLDEIIPDWREFRATSSESVFETKACRRDGHPVVIDLSMSRWDTLNRRFMSWIARDVTWRRLAEEGLRKAMEATTAANQAKSRFISGMSHELRTPLNAILGFGQLILHNSKEPLSPKQIDYVNSILKGGQHLLALVNEVLDLSKIEAGRIDLAIDDVLVGSLLTEARLLIEPLAAGAKIELTTQLPAVDVKIRADYIRVKQALINLLSNAVKYNHEGGRVDVKTAPAPKGMVRISVADTGPGIPLARRNDLFLPFSRLGAETTDVEGTGIGLALSKTLVESMNGSIGFESKVGVGSTFWIDMPAV